MLGLGSALGSGLGRGPLQSCALPPPHIRHTWPTSKGMDKVIRDKVITDKVITDNVMYNALNSSEGAESGTDHEAAQQGLNHCVADRNPNPNAECSQGRFVPRDVPYRYCLSSLACSQQPPRQQSGKPRGPVGPARFMQKR